MYEVQIFHTIHFLKYIRLSNPYLILKLCIQAYAIVYVNQSTQLWINQSQLTSDAVEHLNKVDIRPYDVFLEDLWVLANQSDTSTIWIPPSVSQAITNRIPIEKRLISGKSLCSIGSKEGKQNII